MSRDFAPVSPSIWSSPAFLSLDGDGRQLMLFFISGPHQNSSGCCRVREGYALADLGWTSEQYRAALAGCVAAGLLQHDPKTEETYVNKWFKHKGNNPTNKDHAKGTLKIILNLDSQDLRLAVEADFIATDYGKLVAAPPNPHDEKPMSPDAMARSRMFNGNR